MTVLVFDDCYASGVTGPIDVFHIANQLWVHHHGAGEPLFRWRLVSPDGASVRTSTGLRLEVDGSLEDGSGADAVWVPGSHYESDEQMLALIERLRRSVHQWLQQQYEEGAVLAANCNGAFLLAATGLLENRRSTTSWWLARLFREQYPNVDLRPRELITEDDRLLCAGAVTAHLNLALRLVERYAGQHLALLCARTMLIDANRMSQAPYMMLQTHLKHADDLVLQAQSWMQDHLQQTFNLHDIAGELNVSQRTFIRRFKRATGETPIGYLQNLRIETAKRLLESTVLSLEEIIARVGYTDTSSFRRLFKRQTQLSPREYRKQFSIGGRN
ncbi:MAG: GlxA family transcriptional regulator [Anaerolineales bacterium]